MYTVDICLWKVVKDGNSARVIPEGYYLNVQRKEELVKGKLRYQEAVKVVSNLSEQLSS